MGCVQSKATFPETPPTSMDDNAFAGFRRWSKHWFRETRRQQGLNNVPWVWMGRTSLRQPPLPMRKRGGRITPSRRSIRRAAKRRHSVRPQARAAIAWAGWCLRHNSQAQARGEATVATCRHVLLQGDGRALGHIMGEQSHPAPAAALLRRRTHRPGRRQRAFRERHPSQLGLERGYPRADAAHAAHNPNTKVKPSCCDAAIGIRTRRKLGNLSGMWSSWADPADRDLPKPLPCQARGGRTTSIACFGALSAPAWAKTRLTELRAAGHSLKPSTPTRPPQDLWAFDPELDYAERACLSCPRQSAMEWVGLVVRRTCCAATVEGHRRESCAAHRSHVVACFCPLTWIALRGRVPRPRRAQNVDIAPFPNRPVHLQASVGPQVVSGTPCGNVAARFEGSRE